MGDSTRRVTYHVHRVPRARDSVLEPISSATAQQVVLDLTIEAGEPRLVLSEEDACFITRARDAVPQLVAEVERLQEQARQRHAGHTPLETTPKTASRDGQASRRGHARADTAPVGERGDDAP